MNNNNDNNNNNNRKKYTANNSNNNQNKQPKRFNIKGNINGFNMMEDETFSNNSSIGGLPKKDGLTKDDSLNKNESINSGFNTTINSKSFGNGNRRSSVPLANRSNNINASINNNIDNKSNININGYDSNENINNNPNENNYNQNTNNNELNDNNYNQNINNGNLNDNNSQNINELDNTNNNQVDDKSNGKPNVQGNSRHSNKLKNPKNNAMSDAINNKLNKIRNNNKKKDSNQDDKNAQDNQDKKTQNASNKIANAVGAIAGMNGAAQTMNDIKDVAEEGAEAAKKVVKEKVKQQAKAKIRTFLIQKILIPALPILGILLGLMLFVILVAVIANVMSKDDKAITSITINYCDYVKVKWKEYEIVNGVRKEIEKDETITSNEYIAYDMSIKYYKEIPDEDVLKALAIIHRTNFYYHSNNMGSDTCEFDIEGPYVDPKEDPSNQVIFDAINKTHNKVFTKNKNNLSELEIDDNFTYDSKVDIFDGPAYTIPQDNTYYLREWIDSHVDSNYIVEGDADEDSFSPWAAWYLVDRYENDYHGILYHFLDPKASKGDIYNVIKYGSPLDVYGTSCSDISLNSTALSREEFISYVEQSVPNATFRSNAGKIYDISVANNFNPEMVVIRAMSEGFSPGGSTNNYWGIGCYNGASANQCTHFSSFDAGVLGYIGNIKNHNYATAYQMMLKYAYIGDYWFNPGGSGLGGCYYFPYIRQYLSEERASVVEEACSSGKTCAKGGIGNCTPTTDEDQSAYAKWQVSKMSGTRSSLFGLSSDLCQEEGEREDTGDLSTLGARAAQYAVSTYDSWSYSDDTTLRKQDGYVDCSSMITRAYGHFGYTVFEGANNTSGIYDWCNHNGKMISESQLKAGDLILYSSGSYHNGAHSGGVGHVAMYIGGGKTFAAHGKSFTQENQVSVSSYKNNGSYFCRPAE